MLICCTGKDSGLWCQVCCCVWLFPSEQYYWQRHRWVDSICCSIWQHHQFTSGLSACQFLMLRFCLRIFGFYDVVKNLLTIGLVIVKIFLTICFSKINELLIICFFLILVCSTQTSLDWCRLICLNLSYFFSIFPTSSSYCVKH